MDKESIYELQRIDTNCNDCVFMNRDLEAHAHFKQKWDEYDVWFFESHKRKLKLQASDELSKGDLEGYKRFLKMADNLKMSPAQKSKINYGHCQQKNIKVMFLPNNCTPENSGCFKHRKDA